MSNIDNARAAYDAFNRGDLAAVKEFWAPNIHWWNSAEAQPGGERSGADDVMQLLMEVPNHWSRADVEIAEYIEAGNRVVVRGTQHFANDSGSADVRFAHILTFDADGKCVDSEMHADSAKAYKLQN
jgi:ketosteroid isomerase-like protein